MSPIKRYDQTQTTWTYLSQGRQGLAGPTGPANPGIPSGGTTGQLLSKIDGTTNNTAWINNPIPVGGIAGDAVLKTTNLNYDTQWSSPVPVGTVYQFGGATAPTGYLICEGQSVSTTTFARLFSVIGYTYGGSGANFTIPNLKGRIPVGLDSAQGEFNVRGEVGGSKTHTLSASEIPAHSHPNSLTGTTTFASSGHGHGPGTFHAAIGATNGNVAAIGYVAGFNSGGPGTSTYTITAGIGGQQGFNHYTPVYGGTSGPGATASVGLSNANNTGGGGAHNNLQPYIAINHIIKV
jgi:microcystin-dependent protein